MRTHAAIWVKLENILLSERTLVFTHTVCDSTEVSRVGKSMKTESRLVGAQRWGRGKWRMTANGYEISFWGDETVLKFIVIVAKLRVY